MQHHAYIYEGSQALMEALEGDARERFGFLSGSSLLGAGHHPDVHVRHFEKFGIEESRWLSQVGALKSASGRALFIIGISSITSEAQQALLKLLEEPQEGSIYVLLLPHGALLPTLRSRALEYPLRQLAAKKAPGSPASRKAAPGPDYFSGQATAFLKSSGKDRSDFIAKLLKDDEGEKERARDFINALEAELYKHVRPTRSNISGVLRGLEDIAMVRDYVRDRSPSLKMLLEHLALSLPTV